MWFWVLRFLVIEAKVLDKSVSSEFDRVVSHPIQSWAWGDFKESLGCKVERLGIFEDGKLVDGFQVVFSKLPKLPLTVGYAGKCNLKHAELFPLLKEVARKHHAIFIKTEPNEWVTVSGEPSNDTVFQERRSFFLKHGARIGKSFFTRYDFHLDISGSEDELLESFHSKTRYNTKLAERKGVTVSENTTIEGMKDYVRLMYETTARQGFYNHNEAYFLKLLEIFPKEHICLMQAKYQEKVLTTWVLFCFNGTLYYPYGASSNEYRNVMPNNAVMWSSIRYGKAHSCQTFDLWGCLGPNPDENDSWFGFHKFKSGYNPELVEYIGTYDFVFRPVLYKLFNLADKIRWFLLKKK